MFKTCEYNSKGLIFMKKDIRIMVPFGLLPSLEVIVVVWLMLEIQCQYQDGIPIPSSYQ